MARLLDVSRFYDPVARKVINCRNYLRCGRRAVAIASRLRLSRDPWRRSTADRQVGHQFTEGHLYSDDAPPTGRYVRYSKVRALLLEAASLANRPHILAALRRRSRAQMPALVGSLSARAATATSGGRSLGVVSYLDTLEIVAFLSQNPYSAGPLADSCRCTPSVGWLGPPATGFF